MMGHKERLVGLRILLHKLGQLAYIRAYKQGQPPYHILEYKVQVPQ